MCIGPYLRCTFFSNDTNSFVICVIFMLSYKISCGFFGPPMTSFDKIRQDAGAYIELSCMAMAFSVKKESDGKPESLHCSKETLSIMYDPSRVKIK